MEKLSKKNVEAIAASTGDASNSDLSGVNLSGMELIGLRFDGSDLRAPRLSSAI
jgi:uncharacterized protein YjbI with pentapeptide repeats